jgi:hypothetical protein
MLSDFKYQALTVVIKLKSIKNGWESILIELHVNNGTDN